MYPVEMYVQVRRACMVEGMSVREASRVFGLHRDTVRKMLAYSVPPGYRREGPPRRPKLEAFTGVIDAILEGDSRVPRKQRHTAKRVFERLKDEYGFDGQYTIVKDYVRERGQRTQEMFVPLSHAPGHAQCDFGEAVALIAGVERKVHYFVLDLPHSDGCFVKAYPAETTEAFLDGHVSAFALLGGAPQSIRYDNTKLAVARILGDGRRKRTRAFTELQSHYLFEDRFGRPGKGNDKGKVEGMVGYARRNFLVPVPRVESFEALNAHLQQSADYDEYRARRVVVEHRLARLVQLGIRQARYFGRVKTTFQLYLAATVANLTLVLGNIGLSGGTSGGAAGHRVVLNDVHAVVANAAANFSVIRLGQLWSLIWLTSALLPKSLSPTKTFRPGF